MAWRGDTSVGESAEREMRTSCEWQLTKSGEMK